MKSKRIRLTTEELDFSSAAAFAQNAICQTALLHYIIMCVNVSGIKLLVHTDSATVVSKLLQKSVINIIEALMQISSEENWAQVNLRLYLQSLPIYFYRGTNVEIFHYLNADCCAVQEIES